MRENTTRLEVVGFWLIRSELAPGKESGLFRQVQTVILLFCVKATLRGAERKGHIWQWLYCENVGLTY